MLAAPALAPRRRKSMTHRIERSLVVLALALCSAAVACGGGRTAVVGLGNSSNRIVEGDGIVQDLAEALAQSPATPKIDDEMLAEIFDTILENARDGDAEAALIVLRVAEQQREAADG